MLGLIVPLGATLVTILRTERVEALASSRDSLRKLAELIAKREDDALQEASDLIRVLAAVPDVANAVPERCHAVLQGLVNEHPRIGLLLVSDAAGAVACESGSPVPRNLAITGQKWFQQVTAPETDSIVRSDLFTDVRGKLTQVVATPLRLRGGIGTLSAALDLQSFLEAGDRSSRKARVSSAVVSLRTQTILASSDTGSWPIGAVWSDAALFGALRRERVGVLEQALAGEARIVGFAVMSSMGEAQSAVVVSEDRGQIVDPADRRLTISLIIFATVVATASLVVIVAAKTLMLNPLRRLLVTAQALGSGDLRARASVTRMQDGDCLALAIAINEMAAQLAEREQQLASLARRDGLTGLANRRWFDAALDEAWAAPPAPVAIIMADVDHFKAFNDHYGHSGGDNALRLVAQALCATVRRTHDLVARYGGEEFVLLLPGLDLQEAELVASRLVVAVRELEIPHAGSALNYLTISAGLAWTTRSVYGPSASELSRAADEALYAAKRGGRNQVVVWQEEKARDVVRSSLGGG